MKKSVLGLCLAAFVCSFGSPPAKAAPSGVCDRLWNDRTAIYARKGMCFTGQRELEVFGQRCFRPYGKLTFREQRRVDQIDRRQRREGCKP